MFKATVTGLADFVYAYFIAAKYLRAERCDRGRSNQINKRRALPMGSPLVYLVI